MKKWSYVAAAMLTVASSAALTSCIDNDEPFGIEQIRQATASLLEAKKAAVEAEAAAKSAQVEIAKINAEIEKLRIEKEKIEAQANADYKAAEARYLDALAEVERLKAEGQKAIDDAEAARLLAEAQKAQAEADKWLAEAEKIRKEADAAFQEKMQQIARAQQDAANAQRDADQKYAEALYDFEKKKADAANTANSALWNDVEFAFGQYLLRIDEYNQANKDYMHALNQMAEIEADLIWVDGQYGPTGEYVYGHFESPVYSKKKNLEVLVAEKEREIKKYNDVVTIYDEFIAKLDSLKEGAWSQLLDEYEQRLADAERAVENAKLEQEQVKIDQKDVIDAPVKAEQAIADFQNKDVTIAPYTIDPIEQLSAINANWGSPIEIVPENTTYRVYNSQNTPWLVDHYKWQYNNWIKQFTMAMFDDNDKAWTKAMLTELYRYRDNNESYNKAKTAWELAKKAYNMGGVPKADALPLAAELDAAIAEYNAYEGKIKDARDEKVAADEAVTEKNEAWQTLYDSYYQGELPGNLATFQAAQKAFNEACDEAQSTLAKAVGDRWDPIAQEFVEYYQGSLYIERDNAIRKLNNKVTTLRNNITIADANYRDAQAAADADPNNTALAAAAELAQGEVTKAETAWNDFMGDSYDEDGNWIPSKYETERQAIYNAYYSGRDAAFRAYDKAYASAENTYLKAQDAYFAAGGNDSSKDPAYAAVAAAEKEYKDALEAQREANEAVETLIGEVSTLVDNMNDAVTNQCKEMGYDYWWYVWDYNTIPSYYWDVYNFLYDNSGNTKFPVAIAPVMYLNDDQVYYNAKRFVIRTSEAAYGWLPNYDSNGNDTWDWESDNAFLIDNVTVDTLNMYITKMMKYRWNYTDEQINPFLIAEYYHWFGAFGAMKDVLYKIACAEICLADGAENAITAEIDKLTAARDAMVDEAQAKMDELKGLEDQYNVAYEALADLNKQVEAAVTDAQYFEGVYQNIVNLLKDYVKGLENKEFEDFYDGKYGLTADAIKSELKGQMEKNEELLIHAQDALDYYKYQLAQLESDAYAKVENPWAFEVEFLKARVEKCEEAMNFAKARYEELQAKYDAANKQ